MKKMYCVWCGEKARSKGLCSKHYAWELYHMKKKHGASYFYDYVESHEELAQRGRRHVDHKRRARAA